MMEVAIINRGRGPEIKGTRITVYRIIDGLKLGWHRDLIAAHFRLSSAQVQAAIDYIEEHKDEVMAAYQRIVERSANAKNSPEVEAIRERGRAKLLALREKLRQSKTEGPTDARNGPGQ
jgi:uncharacterized protein (DUF433 family)